MLDIGSSSIRAGYAGDDTPKAVIPTSYGYTPHSGEAADVSMEGPEGGENEPTRSPSGGSNTQSQKKAKLHIGQHGPSMYRHGMEVNNPLQGGLSAP